MFSYSLALFAASCAALLTDAHPLEARQAVATDATFRIWAYGEGISGLPLFFADNIAQIGDPAVSTAENRQPVYFTVSENSRNTWIAHPNTTQSDFATASFESAVLSLPSSDSDRFVQLQEPTPGALSSPDANVFSYYGDYVMIDIENANFYAVPTDTEGVYSLVWSDVASDDIFVVLRTNPPVDLSY
ncbi:hypothetical protein BDW62DRAFT_189427 [Aspergillus aurantiobrunneus]